MTVQRLERALAAIGLPGTVEIRGSLAVLTLQGEVSLEDETLRADAVRIASAHGYTHFAVELPDIGEGGASLHRG
ncbi:MAG TPA: hypothetical protein VFK13_04015 [Gemmatimonadaceae bacterium]|nr:hypothetical protein [Gemmatimonadaceae bacterium]